MRDVGEYHVPMDGKLMQMIRNKAMIYVIILSQFDIRWSRS